MIKLNKEQQEFVDSIVKFWEGDTFEMTLSGAAGTGKTTTLKSAIKEMKKHNISYLMAATTNAAVVRMNECNGEEEQAITVHKTIYDVNQETGEIMEHVTGLGDDEKFKNGIVIVDEASMLGGKDMEVLRRLAKNFSCKIIYVGDAEQLPSVEKNNVEIFKEISGVVLDQVMRQDSDSEILPFATALRRQRRVLFPSCSKNDVVYRKNIAVPFILDQKRGISSVIIVADNKSRVRINNSARNLLGYEKAVVAGEKVIGIHNSSTIVNAQPYTVKKVQQNFGEWTFHYGEKKKLLHAQALLVDGMAMLVIKDFPEASLDIRGINNNELYVLKNMAGKNFVSMKELRNGEKIPSFNKMLAIVTYAYAITCHKSQGGQWEHVYIKNRNNWSFATAEDQYHWLYTAVTRAQKKVIIDNSISKSVCLGWDTIEAICDGGVPVSSQVQAPAEDYTMPEYEECFGGDEVPPPTDADFSNVAVVDCI